MQTVSKIYYRIRTQYYTPIAKPLGVTVPGSPTSSMLGTAALYVETTSENPLAALANEVTEATLKRLPVKILREILEGIHAISGAKVSKSGKKTELIHRILTTPHKATAVQRFLEDKDVQEQRKIERLLLKLFTSLRGALRHAGGGNLARPAPSL